MKLENLRSLYVNFHALYRKNLFLIGLGMSNWINSTKTAVNTGGWIMERAFLFFEKYANLLSERTNFDSENINILMGLNVLKNDLFWKFWLVVWIDSYFTIWELGEELFLGDWLEIYVFMF